MKNLFKIIFLTIFLITLTACSDVKTYKEKGLEITMDKGFYYKTHSQADVYLVKDFITFTGLKDTYASLEQLDLNIDSDVTDYMKTLFANLGNEYAIFDDEGLKYFIYNIGDEQISYNYLVTVYKGSDGFWVCTLSTPEGIFANYQSTFIKWLKTVKVK